MGGMVPAGCAVCGLDGGGGPCPNRWCRRRDRGFSVVYSVGVHRAGLRAAINRYKYRGERRLAGAFADMVASYLDDRPTWFEEFGVITAVPAYVGAGGRRSWDPTGAVLAGLGRRLGPGWDIDGHLVVKTAETPAMAGRSWAERQVIARGRLRRALFVPDPVAVAGRQVLVLDDVMTDGSTLREVALKLLAAGASDVAGLVLARPTWSPQPPRPQPPRPQPPRPQPPRP